MTTSSFYSSGCLPTVSARLSHCDWSTSLARAHAMHVHFQRQLLLELRFACPGIISRITLSMSSLPARQIPWLKTSPAAMFTESKAKYVGLLLTSGSEWMVIAPKGSTAWGNEISLINGWCHWLNFIKKSGAAPRPAKSALQRSPLCR